MMATDLADLDDHNPRQQIALAEPLGGGDVLPFVPQRRSLLLAGASGGGKTTLTTGILERLSAGGFQYCVIDPEGDYEDLDCAISIGTPQDAPRVATVLDVLRKTDTSVALNLLGVKLADRPAFFAGLLPELMALRARTGRPHFIVVDEAHHMLPQGYDPGAAALPADLAGFLFVTVRPDALSKRLIACVDRMVAVGSEAGEAVAQFCRTAGVPLPDAPAAVPTGEMLTLSTRDGAVLRHMAVIPGTGTRRRHVRKYAEGKLGEDKSFFFRGPEGALNLRATNLVMFVQMGDGVDEATWEFHRQQGDYSRWAELSIKDRELTAELTAIETGDMPFDQVRAALHDAIGRRYTLPS